MSTLRTTRIENSIGDGVDVVGLGKIEDTGKNICTAFVHFDASQTPPAILNSFNVSSVDRNDQGRFTINFSESMDTADYLLVANVGDDYDEGWGYGSDFFNRTLASFDINTYFAGDSEGNHTDLPSCGLAIFGGKA